ACDRLGEHALPLQDGWDRRDHGAADGLPLPLVVSEEEGAVAPDRAAEHSAELVTPELRLDGRSRGEEVARVQGFVPEELERRAAKRVAPRPGRQVDDAAVEAAEFRRRAVALDLEFLDGIDVREERHLARLGLEHGDTVEEILVGARTPAVDSRQRRG